MKIDVTQEDIDRGVPRTGDCCPIALALRRTTDRPWQIDRRMAMCLKRDSWMSLVFLPEQATSFINSFDLGKTVAPFTFAFPWEPRT